MTIPRRPLDSIQPADDHRLDIAAIPMPPAWMGDALCAQVDADIFFPDMGGSTVAAKRICAQCPVQAKCLSYALSMPSLSGRPVVGVWGGTNGIERRRLSRRSVA